MNGLKCDETVCDSQYPVLEKSRDRLLNFWMKPSLSEIRRTEPTNSHPVRAFSTQRQTPLPTLLGKELSRGKTSGKICDVQRKPGSSISLHYALVRGCPYLELPQTFHIFVAYSSLSESLLLLSLDKGLPRGKTSENATCNEKRGVYFRCTTHF